MFKTTLKGSAVTTFDQQKSHRRTACITALLVASALTAAVGARDQAWSVVETGSVRAIADTPDAATAALDQVIEVQSMMEQAVSVRPAVPITVFALKNTKAFAEIAPAGLKRRDILAVGFSSTGPLASFMAIRTNLPNPVQTLRHEYMHILTAGQSPDAPAWLEEGLAEFWGAIIVEGDRLIVGRPLPRHLEALRKRKWLPLDAVLKQSRGALPSNPTQVSQFYAQSWAMVHYLLLGQDAGGPLRFMPSTTTLPSQFESVVKQYVAGGHFREVSMPWQAATREPRPVSVLSEASMLAERAHLLQWSEQPKAALPFAKRALTLNPTETLALEVMGVSAFLNNQHAEAREWFGRAIDTGSAGYTTALHMGLLSSATADLEHYLVEALRIRPASEVAWRLLAGVYRRDGRLEFARQWCGTTLRPVFSWLWLGPVVPCR